jgi:Mrp family chromosome partitioning ATPase/DUF971 family protein
MLTEKQILDSLRHIQDPDLHKDIVSLGFIKNLQIENGRVSFTLELTTPACPVKALFQSECEKSVRALPGVTSIEIQFSSIPKKTNAPNLQSLEKIQSIIAVSSCKGGVGKSTVAAYLALTLQREGFKVGLFDADIYGPSIPTLFHLHHPELVTDAQKQILPPMFLGIKVMSLGFVLGDSPAVMRGPMVSNYIKQLLLQTQWGALDYLVIDMPPGTGDIQLTITQTVSLEGALIVTTPQTLSLVDVTKGILMFEKVNVPILGLVENMSYFVCDACDKKHSIFGQNIQSLSERFGLNVLAQFPLIPDFSNLTPYFQGKALPESFSKLTDQLHRQIGQRRFGKTPLPELTKERGYLSIVWSDGKTQTIKNKILRAACRCAHCMDEMTGNPLLNPNDIPEDIDLKEMTRLGNYGVSLSWSDRHSTGIYTYKQLRAM